MSQVSLNLAWTWDWPITPEIGADLPAYLRSFCFLFTVLHSSSAILAPSILLTRSAAKGKPQSSDGRQRHQIGEDVNGNQLREREWCKDKNISASTVLKGGLVQFIPKAHYQHLYLKGWHLFFCMYFNFLVLGLVLNKTSWFHQGQEQGSYVSIDPTCFISFKVLYPVWEAFLPQLTVNMNNLRFDIYLLYRHRPCIAKIFQVSTVCG